MRVFGSLVMKEIVAFFRSWGLVAVVLYSFTLDIYIAGKGIEMQAKNVSVGYVDETGGGISNKILSRLHAPEFQKPVRFLNQKALYDAIRNREIMVGILFDGDFEKLDALREHAENGAVTLRVADTYPAEKASEAHATLEAGGTRGRCVITF